MAVPTLISELSTTASSNGPAGSDAPSTLDDHLRAQASFIATLRDTVITVDGVNTLTNKTLTAPIISTISNTGTLTLPTSTDTIVGRATTDTLTNKTLTNPTMIGAAIEDIFAVVDANADLSPANGSIQTWALSDNRTPVAPTAWTAGQAITLMIDDGSAYTITWTSVPVTWLPVGAAAPTLSTTGYTKVVLWKVGTDYYGVA